MTFKNLLIEDRNAVRTIMLNRPDKLNAMNRETLAELHQVFEQTKNDYSIRVIIIASSGEKAFIAGADISEMAQLSPLQAQEFSRLGQQLMQKIEQLGKPIIARIQGFTLGGGMELAMSCTLRIVSEKAKFGQPEINLGIIPGFGGTQRLLRLAGRGAALELCLLGHQIDAQRAYALGLATRVVAPEKLIDETNIIADQLANSAPHAIAGILDAVMVGGECGIQQGLDYETQTFALGFSTNDMREGTKAFLERRKPNFTGK